MTTMKEAAVEWIALVEAARRERPGAGRLVAEQEARRRRPDLHALVHGLPEFVPERPRPRYPSAVHGLGARTEQAIARPEKQTPPVTVPSSNKVVSFKGRSAEELRTLEQDLRRKLATAKARADVPAFLRDRDVRPSPPSSFWIPELSRWAALPLTSMEEAGLVQGVAPQEEMSLAEAKRRQAADVRSREQRAEDERRLRRAWHAKRPYEGAGYCQCCDHLRSQPWHPDGPDAA